MAIQGFGLNFTANELDLADLLWLYDHHQTHQEIYAAKASINFNSDIDEIKSSKKFSASITFKAWNPDTTRCVDELLTRFKQVVK